MKTWIASIFVCLAIVGCGKSGNDGAQAGQNDFTVTVKPGTDSTGAVEKFKTLLAHCPGIQKYKSDIEAVEYVTNDSVDFLVKVANKTSVMPAEAYGSGHVCHFGVDDSKATVTKRPCAWLCTGEDMTGIDGSDHSYSNGELIGPKVRPWANLREAVASTRMEMSDVQGGDVSTGAAKLAIWGAENMRWADLQEIPTTKYGLVMKDPDAQRGHKLCASGRVIEIEVDRSVPGSKVFLGGMYDDGGRIYRFVALQSTGEIVADSHARLCGIVTGQQHYPNSAGGVTHAVHLVGLFDLPENR